MSLADAAKILGVDPGYLRVAVNRGSLKAQKIGRDWLVTDAEVRRYQRDNLGKKGRPKKSEK